jgi:flagellar hook-associated protein 1 FlgK
MGLMMALNAAVSGLRTTQDNINLVSQNVANANSAGYTRRTMQPVQQVAGDRTAGVRSGEIERVLDVLVQKQRRLETAGSAYTSLRASYAAQLDKLFGSPGGAGALDTTLNAFTQSLQGLLNDPGSTSARNAVLDNAGVLTAQLGRVSDGVQALRSDAEARIGAAVDRANELLAGISETSAKIVSHQPLSDPALLDERDRMIDELSKLMDVQTTQNQNGSVSLSTNAGLTLFNGVSAVKLTFDGKASLAPQALYSADPTQRGVGTIRAISSNGVGTDVIAGGMIRSGEIAAMIEMRDHTLVEAQRQLDEVAAGLSRALSDRAVTGTAATNGTLSGLQADLSGIQSGNRVTLDYTVGGLPYRVVFVAANGTPGAIPTGADLGDPSAVVIPYDINAPASSMQAGLTAKGITSINVDAPSSGVARFLSGGTTVVNGLSASITVTDPAGPHAQLPLFVDAGAGAYTGSFDKGSQLTGFAQRVAVNPALLSNRDGLVIHAGHATQGDPERPQFLLDALTKTKLTFSAATGVSGNAPVTSTLVGFAQQVVETQGANAETANRLDEGQSVALAAIESRFADQSGVNIDQEMAQLVTLQMSYGANARVMTAVRDMMDMLMRM